MARRDKLVTKIAPPIVDAFESEPILVTDEKVKASLDAFNEEKRILSIIAEANFIAVQAKAHGIAQQEDRFWTRLKDDYNLSRNDAWALETTPTGRMFIVGKYNRHKVKDLA